MSPDPNPMPHFQLVRWSRALMYIFGAVAALTVAVSVAWLVIENRRLREENRCRFDLATEVNQIESRIDVAVGRIVEAFVLIDEPDTPPAEVERLQRLIPTQAAVIRSEVQDLEPAIERRANSAEICG